MTDNVKTRSGLRVEFMIEEIISKTTSGIDLYRTSQRFIEDTEKCNLNTMSMNKCKEDLN